MKILEVGLAIIEKLCGQIIGVNSKPIAQVVAISLLINFIRFVRLDVKIIQELLTHEKLTNENLAQEILTWDILTQNNLT